MKKLPPWVIGLVVGALVAELAFRFILGGSVFADLWRRAWRKLNPPKPPPRA